MMKRTVGGQRLGSGNKMTVDLKTYERSTHDLSYIWRSTMAPGTLVPFMTELGLPGDTFDIELDCNIMTHPTVGPLFGSYKVQLDVFMTPIRLYQAQLHNNELGIGMKMANIYLPQIQIDIDPYDKTKGDNQQINPSSIFSYLNMRGVGRSEVATNRQFNAVPYLAYWDIYKNYYANKQEEIGAVIHNPQTISAQTVDTITLDGNVLQESPLSTNHDINAGTNGVVTFTGAAPDPSDILIRMDVTGTGSYVSVGLNVVYTNITVVGSTLVLTNFKPNVPYVTNWRYASPADIDSGTPKITTFPLENIDGTRREILMAQSGMPYVITQDHSYGAPFSLPLKFTGISPSRAFSKMSNQEGLALKTYQSDLFNNWIKTDWLDGTEGINEITAIDTSGGSFTLDTLNLSRKVYDMLNRIAISGGTYDDWLDTVYTHEKYRNCETPMYMGGLIKELVFQEVTSNSETEDKPLGTLAGKGVMAKKHKGGKVTVRVDEPCYIQGIISLTPRLDYSQGNKWDVNLRTMDDLHKPALDEIGFQDLITDQMAWFDTTIDSFGTPFFSSAGKQPAWINYMTNVNQNRGNFAIEGNEMFMTLNRNYEVDETTGGIKDLTTYIDPSKFNDIFAQTSLDAQNFWTQIGVDITARRKMSAKIIPNL